MGPLPDSFLRIEERNAQLQQEAADQQAALALHQQMRNMSVAHDPRIGRLSITISQVILRYSYTIDISSIVYINWANNLTICTISHCKKLLFPGQISEKLWNDKDGSLCEDTSGTFGLWDTYRLKWRKKSTLEQSNPLVRKHTLFIYICRCVIYITTFILLQ